MKAAFLPDRGVVKVSGSDARDFLNGLVTTDMTLLRPGFGRFGALLTPQGKIMVDFLITEAPFRPWRRLPDRLPARAGARPRRQARFLQAARQGRVENLSDSLGVLAAWDGDPTVKPDLTFADPRNDSARLRILVPQELAQKAADLIGADLVDSTAYDAHRIASGVPRGGLDFIYGDAFPHETNMDRLARRRFRQGLLCRPGGGVADAASRHRAHPHRAGCFWTARRRRRAKPFSPATNRVGTMGSSAEGAGLALIRIDRAADALDAGTPLTSGGLGVRLAEPADVRSTPKQTVA